MPDQNINIHLKLLDEFTAQIKQFQNNLGKIDTSMKNIGQAGIAIGRSMKMAGREIGQLGRTMMYIGASITAPLILAFKNAEKSSHSVWLVMEKFRNTMTNLGTSIGESLAPIMDKLVNILSQLVDKWLALDPATQQNILQTIMMTGVLLTLGGTFAMVAGKIISTIGVMIKWGSTIVSWGLKTNIIILAIGTLILLMFKFRWVGNLVMNSFQVVWQSFITGIETIKVAFYQLLEWITRGLAWIAEKFAKVPLPKAWKDWLTNASTGLKKFAADVEKAKEQSLDALLKSAEDNKKALENLFTGKEGGFAKWFNTLADKLKSGVINIKQFMAEFNKLGSAIGKSAAVPKGKTFWEGFNEGLQIASANLQKFGDLGAKVATDMTNSMTSSLSNFFTDAFTGQLKKGEDYFRAFGNAIIKIWMDAIAQMVVASMILGKGGGGGLFGIFSSILGMFGGGGKNVLTPGGSAHIGGTGGNYLGHAGGMITPFGIKAHAGLAIDEVPIVAQTGERILSRSQNRQYERMGKGVQININPIIQLWDASDIVRNRKVLTEAISQAITNNSQLRKVMREYA
jgi:hypothetical protein